MGASIGFVLRLNSRLCYSIRNLFFHLDLVVTSLNHKLSDLYADTDNSMLLIEVILFRVKRDAANLRAILMVKRLLLQCRISLCLFAFFDKMYYIASWD